MPWPSGSRRTCRVASRAYPRRPYCPGRRVCTDLYSCTHDVPDFARARTFALTAGQRHTLHCPRLRCNGRCRLCHRHGEPVAFGVSRFLTSHLGRRQRLLLMLWMAPPPAHECHPRGGPTPSGPCRRVRVPRPNQPLGGEPGGLAVEKTHISSVPPNGVG
jgi:hypothetical protein